MANTIEPLISIPGQALSDNADSAKRALAGMWAVRLFEEAVDSLFARGLMHGTMHLSIGQEGSAVGACAALENSDFITSTHRGHGHCIAKGADLTRMMAELLAKQTGYCRGRGGSMHIADAATGNLGANGIVGGGIPIAAGAGLAQKMKGTDRVVMCFFGDGAAKRALGIEYNSVLGPEHGFLGLALNLVFLAVLWKSWDSRNRAVARHSIV